MAELTIVILSWNTRDLLEECLLSIFKYGGDVDCEILVIDNGSSDGSQKMVSNTFPQVQLVQNEQNLGFAGGNNQGILLSKSPYVLLLNSDAFLTENALNSLMEIMEKHKKAGIVGAQLINRDGSFQASNSNFPGLWQELLILSGLGRLLMGRYYPSRGPENERGPRIVDYVEGACLLVRREAIMQAGYLSEDYFMYAEEVDWCFSMIKAGWEVWYQPDAKIIHLGGASSQNRRVEREGDLYRSRVIFFRKHYGSIKAFLLKWMIIVFVGVKNIYHSFIRFISKGKKGRNVIPLRKLKEKLRGV
jgi:N-acetylglucosaminyl-diphospho-decaprenol L-rhamnosyltransferase